MPGFSISKTSVGVGFISLFFCCLDGYFYRIGIPLIIYCPIESLYLFDILIIFFICMFFLN